MKNGGRPSDRRLQSTVHCSDSGIEQVGPCKDTTAYLFTNDQLPDAKKVLAKGLFIFFAVQPFAQLDAIFAGLQITFSQLVHSTD